MAKKPMKRSSSAAKKSGTKSKPKTSKTVAAEETKASATSESRLLISKTALKDLARQVDECYAKSQSITGSARQMIADCVEAKGLDNIAFGMVMRLRRMGVRNAVRLRSVIENFNYYYEALEIEKMSATQLDLGDRQGSSRTRRRGDQKDRSQIDLAERPDIPTNGGAAETEETAAGAVH